MALAVVRDLRPELRLETSEEVAAFEQDLLAEFVLDRASAGVSMTPSAVTSAPSLACRNGSAGLCGRWRPRTSTGVSGGTVATQPRHQGPPGSGLRSILRVPRTTAQGWHPRGHRLSEDTADSPLAVSWPPRWWTRDLPGDGQSISPQTHPAHNAQWAG